MHSKKLTNKKQNIFSEKQKGFRDSLSYSTPQKSKGTRGNAITQPWSHPNPKFYIFLMGWDRGWVMAFPLVSLLVQCYGSQTLTLFARLHELSSNILSVMFKVSSQLAAGCI